jgi:hypothetical protein
MNRSSNRETRLVALEERMRSVEETLEVLTANARRLNERQDLLTSAILKLNRELGAQRAKYPLD